MYSITPNPTECPACGSAGVEYNHGTQSFKCPEIECGVNWFYRGKVESWQPSHPSNYNRGADGRSVEGWEAQTMTENANETQTTTENADIQRTACAVMLNSAIDIAETAATHGEMTDEEHDLVQESVMALQVVMRNCRMRNEPPREEK